MVQPGSHGDPAQRGARGVRAPRVSGVVVRTDQGGLRVSSRDVTPAVPEGTGERFEELVRVMNRLRSPGGCEWDGAQTHASLLRYLVEEAYEVVEAVESPNNTGDARAGNRSELVEELGDILLQVVFHARIGQEHAAGDAFDITDIMAAVTDKLVRRHPLVFGDQPAQDGVPDVDTTLAGDPPGPARATQEELSARWDAVKRSEKPHRTNVFDGMPPALPALALAEKALSKARRHGVENTPGPTGTQDTAALERAEAEFGDRLLEQVRAASAVGLDSERALRGAVRRYIAMNNRPI
ncbi:nucleoside triphosphate pyrophosphohydrolase [Kocuria sp. cx-116]|nr:nucleoside triphosphate pyrophosphohydrolase [Kocuria sp. cx-116]